MIKYQYAKNQDGNLINIRSINIENKKKLFYCLSCNNLLIAKIGKIKKPHFAHKTLVTCSGETYLHILGKTLFYEEFKLCMETNTPFEIELYKNQICNHFQIEFGVLCKLPKETEIFDLTKLFKKIELERKEQYFIPDILLTSKTGRDKLFIEIAVTHYLSEPKSKSEFRIIELAIEDESDFEPIKERFLTIRSQKIKFKNFKQLVSEKSFCQGNCDRMFDFFVLYKNGKGRLFQKTLKMIQNELKRQKNNIIKHYLTYDLDYAYPEKFKYFIAKSHTEGLNVKNCFLCRYHAQNNSRSYYDSAKDNPIFCKFLKSTCHSNYAIDCRYFRADDENVNRLLYEGEDLIKRSKIKNKL